ncbi:unnamed protein product [Mytilus edulis]|uniref:Uncharacterized protein n=1 Tax=Mytilus edulis TaxID=6550 RepID=A0A8S3R8D4_MYTED|nr:unnamed protein product [Mytilus edulis]
MVNEFGNVFFEPAKETFGSFICRNKTKEAPRFKFSKPWFDLDCKFARQNYRKMKRRRKQRNSDSSKRLEDLVNITEETNATRLKGRPYGIREQCPHEIEQKRKELYPVLKQAKQQNRQASLVRDRLYIDNQLYIPDTVLEDTRTEHTGSSSTNHDTSPKGSYSSDTPPSKRQRQGPSPRPPHTDDSPNSGR